MSTEADVAFACVAALVEGLISQGVRHASISPGSRSTAVALALARHPDVEVHVHLDERSSAFFALGLAKATGAPVAIACTSGTAAANLLPAVVEASMARVPLIVITADRPSELRGVGANQTIDQVGLYGRYVAWNADAPVPGDAPSLEEWRARGAGVAAISTARPPRPVHLNVPFREPLVPTLPARPGSVAAAPAHTAPRVAATSIDDDAVGGLVDELVHIAHGVVYAGGLRNGHEAVAAVTERLGWPLIAEPHSGARRAGALSAGTLLLGCEEFVTSRLPEVVLQIGAAPTSRPALAWVGRSPKLLVIDPDDLVADPLRRASRRVIVDPRDVAAALPDARSGEAERWKREWEAASDRARLAVDALLDAWDEPFEGRIARDLAAALPADATLCVGSSLPVRDLDAFMRPTDGLRVLANRGASGIDGFVSTTLGVAASGGPTAALMGDLTLLHDIGAMAWSARRGYHAVIVVPNNGGGAIFSSLEQRELPELPLFTTPHDADLGAIVRATGAGHAVVEEAAALAPAVRDACRGDGIHVVEVVIDPERDRERRALVREAVDRAVG